MTKNDVLNLIESEQERTLRALTGADPLSERYGTGLRNYTELRWAAANLKECDGNRTVGFLHAEERNAEEDPNEPVADEDKPAPGVEPDSPAEPEKPQPKYTKAQVRKMLGDAQLQHPELNLPELIRSFGVTQLSDIPEERYPELLEKLDEFIAAKESA